MILQIKPSNVCVIGDIRHLEDKAASCTSQQTTTPVFASHVQYQKAGGRNTIAPKLRGRRSSLITQYAFACRI